MIKTWVIYTMLFGYGIPTHDDITFTNESACRIYLGMQYDEKVQEAFKLICVDTSPLMCQGKVCE